MKHLTTLILMSTLALASSASAAEPAPDVKAAVLAAEQKWVDGVIHGDAATLEKLMARDIIYTHSSAKSQTRAEFIQAATSGSTKYTSIDFSDVVVRQYGHTVVITHKAVFKSVQNGESHLFVSEVWAEQNGGWMMVSRQATKLP
jgi:ketosteroid isomerase-like protein